MKGCPMFIVEHAILKNNEVILDIVYDNGEAQRFTCRPQYPDQWRREDVREFVATYIQRTQR